MNRFGWCSGMRHAPLVERAGFDFIEVPLLSFQLENKEAYAKQMKAALASSVPMKAFNRFFPEEIKIVGPDVNKDRVRNYISLAAQTLAQADASIIVLGSADSRNVTRDWDVLRAEEQFLQVLHWCADELRGTNVTLVIEPVNRQESNYINSVAEGALLAEKVNRPEIKVLADFYHMNLENEPLQTLRDYKQWLAHIHVADTDRTHPGAGSYDYPAFVSVLKEIAYDGLISAECKVQDHEEDMKHGLAFMKKSWGIA